MKKMVVYSIGFVTLGCILGVSLFYLGYLEIPKQVASLLSLSTSTTEIQAEVAPEENKMDDSIVKLTEEQIGKLSLGIEEAQPREIGFLISTRGKVVFHPDSVAKVVTKGSGIALEVHKNIGDYVKQGDIVALLESQEIANKKGAYMASLSKEQLAKTSLERERKLYERRISAAQDFFKAQQAYEEARIETRLAKETLLASGLDERDINRIESNQEGDLRIYPLRAPIDGVITSRQITKGDFIDKTSPIYEIVDLNTLWVEMGILPTDLYQVHEGQNVQVRFPIENLSSDAKLVYLSPQIDDDTIVAKAVAELPNQNGKWRAGMFVTVDINAGSSRVAKAVSKEAVQKVDGKDCLFVKTAEGFQKRYVKLGRSDVTYTEILSGLEPSEQCVTTNAFLLKAEAGKNSIKDDD